MTILSTIPFAGFYDSWHDSEFDDQISQMFTDRETGCESAPSDMIDSAISSIECWGYMHQAYAKEYAESFLDEIGLAGKFESMSSPREYNFATDRIFIELTRSDVAKMWREVNRVDLTKACKRRFTSYDGFISGYSSDWQTWGKLSEWDHNQIGTLLECYSELYLDDDFEMYYSGDTHESVYHLLNDWAGDTFWRWVNAWDYIQERAKREIKTMAQYHAARRAENRPWVDTPLGAMI